jgi:hypothetical protein
MTVLATPTEAGAEAVDPNPPGPEGVIPRLGRRRGRRPLTDVAGPLRLEAQTIKAYRLGEDTRRMVGYLRRIVNQRRIPDEARVAFLLTCWLNKRETADGRH